MSKAGQFNIEKALIRLRKIEQEKLDVQVKLDAAINKAKATASEKLAPVVAQGKAVCAEIEAFCVSNRKDIFSEKNKSVKYINGTLGFRKIEPGLKIKDPKKFSEMLLEAWGRARAMRYLHQKLEPNRDALKKLDDETLKTIGVSRGKPKENFYIALDKKAALEQGPEAA